MFNSSFFSVNIEIVLIYGCFLSVISWEEFYDDPMSVAILTTFWWKCTYQWLNKYFIPVHDWYFTTIPYAKSFNQITTTSLFLFIWSCLQISSTYVVYYFLLMFYYRIMRWSSYCITRNKIKDTIEIKFTSCGCTLKFWDQSAKLAAVKKKAAGDWKNLNWGYEFKQGSCSRLMEKVHVTTILSSIIVEFYQRCHDVLEVSEDVWVDCVCCPACSESRKLSSLQMLSQKSYCVCCPACSDSDNHQTPQTSNHEPSGAKQKKLSNEITVNSMKNKNHHAKKVSNLSLTNNNNNKPINNNLKKLNVSKTIKESISNNSKENVLNKLTKVNKQLLVNNKSFSEKKLDLKFSENAPCPYFFQAGMENNKPLRNRINKLQAWLAKAPRPGGGSLRQSFFTFQVLKCLVELAENQTKLRPHFVTLQHTKQLRSMARKLTSVEGNLSGLPLSEFGGLESDTWLMMKSIWSYLQDWRRKLGGKPFKQNSVSFPSSSWAKFALLLYIKGTQLDKLTCLLSLGPVRRCAWCDRPEKEPGSLHLCLQCVTFDFPNISVTCSRTCTRRWWKFEHWAEHLEHSLGLYVPKPL